MYFNQTPAVPRTTPRQVTSQGSCTDSSVSVLLQQALADERHKSQFSDVTVMVEGVEFKCHRLILTATSGFFRSLFSSGMREAKEGVVTLHGVPRAVFTDLMKWMYDGDPILSLENVFEVLPAADQLDIQVLFAECTDFLLKNISVDNCVKFYHASMVFNCDELLKKSWAFLNENFDSICTSGKFCELTFDDIKSLGNSSELVIRSEDVIVESILQWYRSEKSPMSHEKKKNKQSPLGVNAKIESHLKTTSPEEKTLASPGEDGVAKLDLSCWTQQQKSETGIFQEDQTSTEEDHEVSEDREENDQSLKPEGLADLLEATRYLLISGNCVWQTLANDAFIQNDSRCRAIQEKILRYKTRPDCHQFACIPAAVHRMTSGQRNVVLACFNNSFSCKADVKIHWQELVGSLRPSFQVNASTLVYYSGKIYVQSQRQALHVFSKLEMRWYNLTDAVQQDVKTVTMMPVGNDLVTINTCDNESYTVECFSIQGHQKGKWILAGELSMRGMEIACVTNIGPRLIIFWKKAGNSCLTIECFDLVRRESFILPHQLNHLASLVAFKHEDEAFALQDNGALWRMSVQPEPPYITVKHELWLWNFQRALGGALLFNGELVVFENIADNQSAAMQLKEDTCLENVFSKVRSCYTSSVQTKFIHAVVPQSFIIAPASVN